jgi:hypothetical protein
MLYNFFSSTKYKHWLYGLLIGLIVFFSLVSIVYEEWTISSDNISGNLSVEEVGFYLHFSHYNNEDKNWELLPADMKITLASLFPNFIEQQNIVKSLSPQEYAYVLFKQTDEIAESWLLFWPQQTLPILPNNLTAATSGNLLIISQQAEQVKQKYFNQNLVNNSLAAAIWPGFSRPARVPYAFIDFAKLPTNFQKFDLQGTWRVEIYDSFIEIVALTKQTNRQSNYANSQWLDSFYGEDMFFYNLNPVELNWIWQQNQASNNWYKNLQKIQAMTGINLEQELINLGGYYNLVVSAPVEYGELPTWVAGLPNEAQVHNLLVQIVGKILGYSNPQIKETFLPDKTVIKEFIAQDQIPDFQTYSLSGQEINIIYFSPSDYLFYTQINNQYVIGNSLKLLNRLISRAQGEAKQTICQNNPEANFSFKSIDKEFYSFSYWSNTKLPIFRFCY